MLSTLDTLFLVAHIGDVHAMICIDVAEVEFEKYR